MSVYIQCFAPQLNANFREGFEWKPIGSALPLKYDSDQGSQWTTQREVLSSRLRDFSYPFKFFCRLSGDHKGRLRRKYYSRLITSNYIVTGSGHSSNTLRLEFPGVAQYGASEKRGSEEWYIWFLNPQENRHLDIRNQWEINQSLVDFRNLPSAEFPRSFELWANNAEPLVSPQEFPNRPKPSNNNIWYHQEEGDTVFVFVHGILSDSADAWFYQDDDHPDQCQYWPELVKDDPQFANSSIFLGGYYSHASAGPDYGFGQGARTLFTALEQSHSDSGTALDKQNIIFVAHSAGGLVVRDVLTSNTEKFEQKNIGLLFVASPAKGSVTARVLRVPVNIVRYQMGKELAPNSQYLRKLDEDFKSMRDRRGAPSMFGKEIVEHFHTSKWLRRLNFKPIVEYGSAATYFSQSQIIENSDHNSIAKPPDLEHDSHRALRIVYQNIVLPTKIDCDAGGE